MRRQSESSPRTTGASRRGRIHYCRLAPRRGVDRPRKWCGRLRRRLAAAPDLEVRDGQLLLSLEDAIIAAMRRNLGLQVQRYRREQAFTGIMGAQGIFDLEPVGATQPSSRRRALPRPRSKARTSGAPKGCQLRTSSSTS